MRELRLPGWDHQRHLYGEGRSGNTTIGVQHVTVHEPTPPTFTNVPASLSFNTGAGATSCGIFVGDDYEAPPQLRTTVTPQSFAPACRWEIYSRLEYTDNVHGESGSLCHCHSNSDRGRQYTADGHCTGCCYVVHRCGCDLMRRYCQQSYSTLVNLATDNCSFVNRSGVPAANFFPAAHPPESPATDAHGNTARLPRQ